LLHNAGCDVTVVAAKPMGDLAGDAAINGAIVVRMGLPIVDCLPEGADLIVDALLGTGFHGRVREPIAGYIRAINGSGACVLAVDVPSGLDCDTGLPADPTVRADVTVTFVAEKTGFVAAEAGNWLGRVVVADIGAPPAVIRWACGEA